jgi:hypothetical protein
VGQNVFFPTIDQRRLDLGYQGKALLLMDGFGSHHTEQFLAECAARNIEVLFPIADVSDPLQPLDLLTFPMMKQTFSASKADRLANPQSNKVFACGVRGSQRVPLTTNAIKSYVYSSFTSVIELALNTIVPFCDNVALDSL